MLNHLCFFMLLVTVQYSFTNYQKKEEKVSEGSQNINVIDEALPELGPPAHNNISLKHEGDTPKKLFSRFNSNLDKIHQNKLFGRIERKITFSLNGLKTIHDLKQPHSKWNLVKMAAKRWLNPINYLRFRKRTIYHEVLPLDEKMLILDIYFPSGRRTAYIEYVKQQEKATIRRKRALFSKYSNKKAKKQKSASEQETHEPAQAKSQRKSPSKKKGKNKKGKKKKEGNKKTKGPKSEQSMAGKAAAPEGAKDSAVPKSLLFQHMKSSKKKGKVAVKTPVISPKLAAKTSYIPVKPAAKSLPRKYNSKSTNKLGEAKMSPIVIDKVGIKAPENNVRSKQENKKTQNKIRIALPNSLTAPKNGKDNDVHVQKPLQDYNKAENIPNDEKLFKSEGKDAKEGTNINADITEDKKSSLKPEIKLKSSSSKTKFASLFFNFGKKQKNPSEKKSSKLSLFSYKPKKNPVKLENTVNGKTPLEEPMKEKSKDEAEVVESGSQEQRNTGDNIGLTSAADNAIFDDLFSTDGYNTTSSDEADAQIYAIAGPIVGFLTVVVIAGLAFKVCCGKKDKKPEENALLANTENQARGSILSGDDSD